MKKHNFNAGPSILPREVIEDTAKAIRYCSWVEVLVWSSAWFLITSWKKKLLT